MKKCRQCGMLSADTAVMCRHCNVKFTEDDKPIVVKQAKKRSSIPIILLFIATVLVITTFTLFQTGLIKTWSQSAEKAEIKAIAEEFINADFKNDTKLISSYMFDNYKEFHKKHGTFSLSAERYISFYFSQYNSSSSIEVLSVNSEFLEEDFQLYSEEISNKYLVTPTKIVSVIAEVKITDEELSHTIATPMTFIKLDKGWFVLPVL